MFPSPSQTQQGRTRYCLSSIIWIGLIVPLIAGAANAAGWAIPADLIIESVQGSANHACSHIANRLGSVTQSDCADVGLELTGAFSAHKAPILLREYPPFPGRQPRGRVLLFGGIHGDELSSVSIVFKWMQILNEFHSGLFHWHVVPVLNPDGLGQRPAQRTNANGVDLNRNFPSPDWSVEAPAYWIRRTFSNPRRYPGLSPLSEPESRWLAAEIRRFQPDVIVAVHAPLEVLDFDGPPEPPRRLGSLWLDPMGTYPGSLGRWAGLHLRIPVVTIELPSAGVLPSESERLKMWTDLVSWLKKRLPPRSGGQTAGG
jgi:hypothetical protein